MFSQIKLLLGINMMLFVVKQHVEITPHVTTARCLVVKKHDIAVVVICTTECLQAPVMKLLYPDKIPISVSGSFQWVCREADTGRLEGVVRHGDSFH